MEELAEATQFAFAKPNVIGQLKRAGLALHGQVLLQPLQQAGVHGLSNRPARWAGAHLRARGCALALQAGHCCLVASDGVAASYHDSLIAISRQRAKKMPVSNDY